MKRAFTLAEVLITLGIIGIVAALTIPTLIGDYRNKERSVRLKKSIFWTFTGNSTITAGTWRYYRLGMGTLS